MTLANPTGQGLLHRTEAVRHASVIGDARNGTDADPFMDIENRSELVYTLGKAAELEHLIICQYLYARSHGWIGGVSAPCVRHDRRAR